MLPEPALDTLRAQAIKLHRRNRIIMVMGFAFLALILGGMPSQIWNPQFYKSLAQRRPIL